MRIVIEEIEGENLVLLCSFLRKINFGNKEEIMKNWERTLAKNDGLSKKEIQEAEKEGRRIITELMK